MKERIQEIIHNERLTSTRFADLIGVQRSSISHVISGRNNPSLDFMQKVLQKFNYVNPEWLLFGTGEMIRKEFAANAKAKPEIAESEQQQEKSVHFEAIKTTPKMQDSGKRIHKIVVFYSDNTFDEYAPR